MRKINKIKIKKIVNFTNQKNNYKINNNLTYKLNQNKKQPNY